jgi:hypothetical protein
MLTSDVILVLSCVGTPSGMATIHRLWRRALGVTWQTTEDPRSFENG